MGKNLVAYFSASGVTAQVAKEIAVEAGADLFEIKAKVPYTKADLDWTDSSSRSSVEMKDPAFRPEIAETLNNFGDYDVIFLGFPIWWYVAPTIINSFLESYNFEGKTIIPFFTSGGSGSGQTDEKLHPSAPNAIWRPAKRLYSGNADRIKSWVDDSIS